jgi:hypothetical protein
MVGRQVSVPGWLRCSRSSAAAESSRPGVSRPPARMSLAHEDGQGQQEHLDVLAWRGEPGQGPDLDVSQAGITEQARGAAAGMEVPAGSRVDVVDLGQ